ncbi:chemotaxis protein MotB [Thiohalospira halophila DSM 15071]|uniref:Chemotaxis protein MotB n=1 Tax=Thiohalospira halophila DSM 15071 TaxID=1123397 RepID=A0A1I1QJP1_9GAMM|nr:OmpA family protein [Thiohalospira halophila]SFD18320.1 chemotaxis protein MotB [Thiohalospira halophila DSM 15071]
MRAAVIILAILAVALGGTTWKFHTEARDAREQVVRLQEVNREIGARARELAEHQEAMVAEVEKRLAAEDENFAELDRIRSLYEELVAELEEEIQRKEVAVNRMADRLSVRLVERVLFRSGSAELSDAGRDLLSRVGRRLQANGDYVIRVEGHTDNVPIGEKLVDTYPTNWELSARRAVNVVRHLQEEAGVDPERLQAVGRAEHRPVADNATAEGRARNRRMEIHLVPPSPAAGVVARDD